MSNSFALFNTGRVPYLLILGAVFLLFSGTASAFTINQFNDSTTTKFLNISAGNNMIYINSSRNIQVSYLNLTMQGLIGNVNQNLTGSNHTCVSDDPTHDPCYLANDGDFVSNGGINMGSTKYVDVYINYSQPSAMKFANLTTGFYSYLSGAPMNISIYDYTDKTWLTLYTTVNCGGQPTGTYWNITQFVENTDDRYWDDTRPLYVRIHTSSSSNNMCRITETANDWDYYPSTITGDPANDNANTNSTDVYNTTVTLEMDVDDINDYLLNTCTADWETGTCNSEINLSDVYNNGYLYLTGLNFVYDELGTIGDCSNASLSMILNFTFRNEDNLTFNTGDYKYTLESTDNSNISVNGSGSDVWYFDICGNNDSFTADMIIEYDQLGYGKRFYFLDNATLSGQTGSDITLYLLDSDNGSSISISAINYIGYSLTYTYVQFQKYYIDENNYRTVAMVRTDNVGAATAFLYPTNTWYKYIMTKDGEVLATIGPSLITGTSIILSTAQSDLNTWYDYNDTISYSCVLNGDTYYLTCTLVDATGVSRTACLDVDEFTVLNFTNFEEVCDTGSSLTLISNLSELNSFNKSVRYRLYITDGSRQITLLTKTEEFGEVIVYGTFGIIITIMIFLLAAAMGKWNPALSVTLGMGGIMAAAVMGLISIPLIALGSLLFVAAIIIYKVNT